jgi:hypothetical protein
MRTSIGEHIKLASDCARNVQPCEFPIKILSQSPDCPLSRGKEESTRICHERPLVKLISRIAISKVGAPQR